MNFKSFLLEAAPSEEKLEHLEHVEDHHINAGEEGFQHAFNTLHQTHQLLTGNKSEASVSTKFDGSPSIVFGYHPENGKFFVASKSAFNATPKLNYTPEDIEKNHGHAPGLVSKLKAALQHLPKVTPKKGVYQGDIMYDKDEGDVKDEGGKFHFKSNTLTYSIPKTHDEGKKIESSKFGVAVHTAYHGDTFKNMKAEYNADTSNFRHHPDVHLLSTEVNINQIKYSPEQQALYKEHMANAVTTYNAMKNHKHLNDEITSHLKEYINKTVKTSTNPTVEGFKQHIVDYYNKKASSLKTQAGKQGKIQKGANHISHIIKNENAFSQTLELHRHLQAAKNVLNNALSSAPTYEHRVGKQKVKPEGHVVVINNRPSKFVDRDEFSKLNFQARS